MILFQSKEIGLRTLELEDAGLLVRWLSDPVVLEYYEGRDRPLDAEQVRKHFYEEREEIIPCIIQYNGNDIGYLQFYEIQEEERDIYGFPEDEGAVYGMDQFIGEYRYWNKGIGTELIRETVRYLIKERGARRIAMDPQAWNARALRVYEKSGFKKTKLLEKHEWHEGEYRDCWLIVYDADAADA
ncbi:MULTISPECIES: GNAT family N-acetyltransferase [unclassified Paenibacillus]|uniref:GNAT family N-acetyltransferase n=1 Tax=unclassified Paenibacillus TaxID=185978 RepID=UPI00104CED4D|nr:MULTISPECIES: GNAT family N-acetyltransferase [unclassified Paenibacillus]NIK70861.1 aminoglycoside 6'-N-acetyltransferase [Paenibacillus sp. BK720]TCM93161.1 aminoglycoside 6'-N-acetyltransferase [Paenibacillus sp. BK033]